MLFFQGRIHTHTCLTSLCPGLPRWAGTRKVKPIWILLEQETVSSSGISWAICKSAPRSRQITTPALHYSSFLQAGCPSCHPTNSVKALKAKFQGRIWTKNSFWGFGPRCLKSWKVVIALFWYFEWELFNLHACVLPHLLFYFLTYLLCWQYTCAISRPDVGKGDQT